MTTSTKYNEFWVTCVATQSTYTLYITFIQFDLRAHVLRKNLILSAPDNLHFGLFGLFDSRKKCHTVASESLTL